MVLCLLKNHSRFIKTSYGFIRSVCFGLSEGESAEPGNFSRLDTFRRNQDPEVFSHPFGSNQVLQLQSPLGALLRQAAFFEGFRELIALADSQQKLRLRE